MKEKAFTLIELLVVVAIIGILAAVGLVAYNGYTASAKKSATTANHKNVVKYIINEVMKCSTGASKAMNNELDCTKQGLNNWKDFVAKAVERSLSNLKTLITTVSKACLILKIEDLGSILMSISAFVALSATIGKSLCRKSKFLEMFIFRNLTIIHP